MSAVSAEKIRPEEWFTVDDFFALIEEGRKADLIDGVIYVASPDTPRHHKLAAFLEFVLSGYVERRKLGEVYGSRVAFVLTESDAPEPDVAFLSEERLDIIGDVRIQGSPDVAVEIVSRESRARDYGKKRKLYEEAGVREYWIIDPLKQRTLFLRLRDAQFEAVPLENGRIYRSEAVPGFWLDVNWLLGERPPSSLDVIDQVLAGEPRIQE